MRSYNVPRPLRLPQHASWPCDLQALWNKYALFSLAITANPPLEGFSFVKGGAVDNQFGESSVRMCWEVNDGVVVFVKGHRFGPRVSSVVTLG